MNFKIKFPKKAIISKAAQRKIVGGTSSAADIIITDETCNSDHDNNDSGNP